MLLLGQYLLTPTKIYVKNLLPILRMENKVKALAHITGGGLPGNVERVLPKNMRVVIDANHWVVPPVFGWIAEKVRSGRVRRMVFLAYSFYECACVSFLLPSLK